MEINSFLLGTAELEFENSEKSSVSFLSPNAEKTSTHITLIVGANGTSKSRTLASLVEQLCDIQDQRVAIESSRKYPTSGTHGLICTALSTFGNGQESHYLVQNDSESLVAKPNELLALPSRILVLSNLVMDKFHYPKVSGDGNQFYHYLGVRQSTNMMTSGSMDRSVTEAILSIGPDQKRLKSFQEWVALIFSGTRELALKFPRLSVSTIKKYLALNDKKKFLSDRMQSRSGSGRSISNQTFSIDDTEKKITELFEFLIRKFTVYSKVQKETRDESQVVLRLSALTKIEKIKLTQLPLLLTAAARVGYSPWPSLCFESSPWLQFNQLSSGEQNLLSVGAKIIAHARPGCLIAIDEPEISLNVAWQQHYTDLILKSLSHSPGSHVLIATHSPHFIASVPAGKSSVVLVERNQKNLSFKTMDSHFEGWGAEAILYQVLGIPSASSFLFERELAKVLRHIQDDGTDKNLIKNFITLASKLDFAGIEPLEDVVGEIKIYLEGLP